MAYFAYMRSMQKQGVAITTFLARLNDLNDPRVVMIDESGSFKPLPGSYLAKYFLSLP
jgi:hypothetical protein